MVWGVKRTRTDAPLARQECKRLENYGLASIFSSFPSIVRICRRRL
jgi:hypothetical protein